MLEKLFDKPDKIEVREYTMPQFEPEAMTIEIPSFKIIYVLSFDEMTKPITKEVKLFDWFDLTRIPHKDDSITFGDEIGRDCGFTVESVSRSQDKNEIMIIGKHYGHDSGLIYDTMVKEHGFEG